jgi:hypothetical protein
MRLELFNYILFDKKEFNSLFLNYDFDIADLNSKIAALNSEIETGKSNVASLHAVLDTQEELIADLKSQIQIQAAEAELETYWNTKRPKADITYLGRSIPNKNSSYKIDVRTFFNPNDSLLPVFTGTNDEIALAALRYVNGFLTYVSDKENVRLNEYWQFPFETIALKISDCEDGAALIANIMLKSGIPYWRLRLNAGLVEGGAHAYVTYLAEDNEWYVLDWCFNFDDSVANFKKVPFSKLSKYYAIWFSWNQKYAFYDMAFTDAANDKKHKEIFEDKFKIN